ncbi:Hepatocyte growth factor-regulated tyrosine kinase substrate, partial [Globisporangium splendens]
MSHSMRSSSSSNDSDQSLHDPVKPEMSVREKEHLTTIAKSMTESLLEATDLLGGIPWCLVLEKHGISLFRTDVGNNVPCNVHAVCKVTCEIEDVAESMVTNTTESYTKMMEMLSSDFIEGAVIENIVEPTEQNPHRYVALKWAAFKSSSKFTKDRDFIILEYVDMVEDDQGQKVAFRIMESVDVPASSKYAESPKYIRDIVPLMGFMYHTTKKQGELRMTYTCNFDNGDLPAWAANSAIQSHVEKCINGILKYIETFRAKKETIVLPQQVIPMSEQDHCHVCERNFCVLRRKYNCLKCGEVICSNCSRIRAAHIPDHGERQLRVCTACVLEVRRTSRNESSPHSTSAASSNGSEAPCSPGKSGSVVRTQSFSNGKRRSYDDLLEPVRNRLMEHKTFSANPDVVEIPKASFPMRSLSDGFVMRKGNFFTSRRRGSPADLAMSIDAFRHHQLRRANNDLEPEDGDLTDTEESFRQFERFSSSSNQNNEETSPTNQARSPSCSSQRAQSSPQQQRRHQRHPPPESALLPLNATQPLIEEGVRSKKYSAFESKIQQQHALFPTTTPEAKAKLNAAIELSHNIISDAKTANELAQYTRRRLSRHRVLALQREYEVMGPVNNNNNNNSMRHHHHNQRYESPRRATPYSNEVVMLTQTVEDVHLSNQYIDAGFRRHHTSQSRERAATSSRHC